MVSTCSEGLLRFFSPGWQTDSKLASSLRLVVWYSPPTESLLIPVPSKTSICFRSLKSIKIVPIERSFVRLKTQEITLNRTRKKSNCI